MDRRTFFRNAGGGAAAAMTLVASPSSSAMSIPSEEGRRRTAVTVTICVRIDGDDDAISERNTHDVEFPDAFVPCGVSCTQGERIDLTVFDSEGELLHVDADAFREGPLEFWREPKGPLKVRAMCYLLCCVPPTITVTIFGTTPR